MVVLADLEIFCSRPHAPTRRVALGDANLPCEPPPGFGGILLGGIVAAHVGGIDPDLIPDLQHLTREMEAGRRVPQPRMRYRLQVDTIGLNSVRHKLLGEGERLSFDFDEQGAPAQQVLGAVYAAGALDPGVRRPVMATIRRAIGWAGPVGADLIANLSGVRSGAPMGRSALENPTAWALDLLGFTGGGIRASGGKGSPRANGGRGADGGNGPNGGNGAGAEANGGVRVGAGATPPAKEVLRRYRDLLMEAHPDHGASIEGAAQRIAELTEARRILTGR